MRQFAALIFVCVAASVSPAAEKDGLVARYTFDEGSGERLRDVSGHGNHGVIHGAKYVKRGKGYALEFNGRDNYVDCGALSGMEDADEFSIETWIVVDPRFEGEPGLVNVTGAGRYDLQISYYYGGTCSCYVGGAGNYARSVVPTGGWHHVVATYDKTAIKLYVNGRMENAYMPKEKQKIPPKGIWIIGSQTPIAGHWRGMIDDVAIYRKALTGEQVRQHYKRSGLTGELDVKAHVSYFRGRVVVTANLHGLGELPEGAELSWSLLRNASTPVAKGRHPWSGNEREVVELAASGLKPGLHEVRVFVVDAAGKRIGQGGHARFAWPHPPTPPHGGKVLNNLVTQLLEVSSHQSAGRTEFEFVNPREGPVYVEAITVGPREGDVTVSLDGAAIVHKPDTDAPLETMRFLKAGKHRIAVTLDAGTSLRTLVVRAVPVLVYNVWSTHIAVREYPAYDFDFLEKDIVRNVNAIRGGDPLAKGNEKIWNRCRREGKWWLNSTALIHKRGNHAKDFSADYVARQWINSAHLRRPEITGTFVDENHGGSGDEWAAWIGAVRKVHAETGKSILTYCGAIYPAGESAGEMLRANEECGGYFAHERYLGERPSLAEQWDYLQASLAEEMERWKKHVPGCQNRMIICPGYFSGPPESLDTNPAVDFKIVLDMEMNILANAPACRGLAGVMFYMSRYADEEIVRWGGKLFRHYFIEGKNSLLSEECGFRHSLPHLENPAFEQGTRGWRMSPAEKGSMEVRDAFGFGYLWGMWPGICQQGEKVLWTRRNGANPNVFSQQIRGLERGRLYNLRMIVADYGNITAGKSERERLALSVRIHGAEMVPSKCFQSVFRAIHSLRTWGAGEKPWMNYVWRVFRANGNTATLTVSDWASAPSTGPPVAGQAEPGGPVGQELVFSFIQIQPYIED